MRVFKLLYVQSFKNFGYEFFVRKRIEKRLWSIIGAHLKALDQVAAKQKYSHSA